MAVATWRDSASAWRSCNHINSVLMVIILLTSNGAVDADDFLLFKVFYLAQQGYVATALGNLSDVVVFSFLSGRRNSPRIRWRFSVVVRAVTLPLMTVSCSFVIPTLLRRVVDVGVDLVKRLQYSIGWGDGRVDSGDRKLPRSFLLHLSSIFSFALIKSCLFFSREDIEMAPIIRSSLYFCHHCSLKVGGKSWVSSSWWSSNELIP